MKAVDFIAYIITELVLINMNIRCAHDMLNYMHKNLCNQLSNIKGKFSLSYYEFDLLNKWFPKDKFVWESREFVKAASATKGKAQNKGIEILIMNYNKVDIPDPLKLS